MNMMKYYFGSYVIIITFEILINLNVYVINMC